MAILILGLLGIQEPTVAQSEETRLIEILGLEPGMRVADVGAGEGEWIEALAASVGPTGLVFATEVEEDKVESLERLIRRERIENAKALLGDQESTGLDSDCCDAVLLRLVYHHFTRPSAMRASLKDSVRAGGLIAIIDIDPQQYWRDLPGVPDRGGHGIPLDDLVREMASDGFVEVSRHLDWDGDEDRFCVIFRR